MSKGVPMTTGEAHPETRRMMETAIRRLNVLEYVILGVAMALATLTLLSAAPAGVGIGAALLWRRPKDAWRYAAAGLATFLVLNLVFAVIWGAPFFDNAYLYHLGKRSDALHSFAVFRSIAYADPWILYAGLAGAASLLLRRTNGQGNGEGNGAGNGTANGAENLRPKAVSGGRHRVVRGDDRDGRLALAGTRFLAR